MCHLIVIFIQDVCMLILLMCDGFIKLKWFHALGFFSVKLFGVLSNRGNSVWNERSCLLVYHIYPNNISPLLLVHPTNSHRKNVTTWYSKSQAHKHYFVFGAVFCRRDTADFLKRSAVRNDCKSSLSDEKCLSEVNWGSFTFIYTCSRRRNSMFCIPEISCCIQLAAEEAEAGPDSLWAKQILAWEVS